MDGKLIEISKFLSLVLRHKPETIRLTLDQNGWADIDELVSRAAQSGKQLSRTAIESVVASNDKRRFALSKDGAKIRANQGHSIDVDLALPPQQPPEILYHGTASRFVDSIRGHGLHSGSRQHVHLSLDEVTATKVGQRHGKPVILRIRAGDMCRAGLRFYCSENGVWLTESVSVEYIEFP